MIDILSHSKESGRLEWNRLHTDGVPSSECDTCAPCEIQIPTLCTCCGPACTSNWANRSVLQEQRLFISPGAVPMKALSPTKTFAHLAQATNRFGTNAKNNCDVRPSAALCWFSKACCHWPSWEVEWCDLHFVHATNNTLKKHLNSTTLSSANFRSVIILFWRKITFSIDSYLSA